MTELKIFKDLIEGCGKTNGTCERCQDGIRTDEELDMLGIICKNPKVDYNKSRQEAIKWIKSVVSNRSSEEELKKQDMTLKEHLSGICAMTEWIKHFFNITEEELK